MKAAPQQSLRKEWNCGQRNISASEGSAVDFGTRRLYLAIRRLRLATVSGISSANGAVAEWLKAAVC